jgi:acyl-CoA reductase-like NAD-dependent aldehyde dehydrogenase
VTNTQTSPVESHAESAADQGIQVPSPTTAPATPERGELFVGGEWIPAARGGRRDVVDPSTGNAIGTVAEGDAADVDAAVTAARAAFVDGPWRSMSGRERARVLHRVADLIRENADELVRLESLDVGKPVTLCRAVDVATAAEVYEYYSGLAQAVDGATRETPMNAFAYTRREPLGVVAAITPFNFPLILSSSKIAPALAAGNVVVHKPADDTPLSALFMAKLLAEAGVPDGVMNVVTGAGNVAGEALLGHPGVDKIAFTGSTAIGRHAAAVAGEALTSVTMELGGNAAQIVFEDADVEKAVGSVIRAFVFNTGQFCMGGPRLLVARPLYDTFLGILAEAVPGVPLGDPRDPGTVIGPMAAERHVAKVEGYVAQAIADGGRIVCGGERLDLNGGFYFKPTVIADLANDSSVVQEEIFGPVLTVQPFDTEEEAIAMANSTPYGLASGLQTTNLARAHRVAAQLDAGIVWVNDWAMLDPAVPFGGVKASGFGREYGPEGLATYTRDKSVVISLD